jgi:uncharacterized OB-fold protein
MENTFTHTAYVDFLKQHRLLGTRDVSTGEVFLPPKPVNPVTYSDQMEWMEFSGKGVLKAFTNIFINGTAMAEAGFNRTNPCTVGIVKTAEGPMISALILGVNGCDPGSIKIGTPLKVRFLDIGEGETTKTLLAFEPENKAG